MTFCWDYLKEEDAGYAALLREMVLSNDLAQVKTALENGADIGEKDLTGATPLHLAVRSQNRELFALLLEKGAHPYELDREKRTPLRDAIALDTEGFYLRPMIESRPARHKDLELAIELKNVKAVELLLQDKDIPLFEENQQALQQDVVFFPLIKRREMLFSNDLVQVKTALEQGAGINEKDLTGSTPLHFAVRNQNWELFAFLLEEKPFLFAENLEDNSPLNEAILIDTEGSYLLALLERGELLQNRSIYRKRSPLTLAIEHKNLKAIELLLSTRFLFLRQML